MIKLYDKYFKRGIVPKNIKVWRICRLSTIGIIDRMKIVIKKKMKG